MVRGALGVLGGGAVWMVLFLVLARLLYLVWPDYALQAHQWVTAAVYGFTPLMSAFNASFWILAAVGGGWLAVVIAQRSGAALVLAALVMAYLCFMHLYYVWDRLPWWYNLLVAVPSGPAVLLGGRLAEGFARRRSTVAA
jgi:hypothetical protein